MKLRTNGKNTDDLREQISQLSEQTLNNVREPNPNPNLFDISTAVFTAFGGYGATRTITKTDTGINVVCTSVSPDAYLGYTTEIPVLAAGRYLFSCNVSTTNPRDAATRLHINGVAIDFIYGTGELACFLDLTAEDVVKVSFYDHMASGAPGTTTYSDIKLRKCDSLVNRYNSHLKGKKVLFFGDSHFGKCPAPSDIPSVVYDLTGANCINVSMSGTTMADHPTASYTPFSGNRLADAITTGTWTTQDAQASARPEFTAKIAILKALDFKTVDAIIVGYGTNDHDYRMTIDGSGTNATDFAVAYKYFVETILTKYPHIKMLLVAPPWRAYGETKDSNSTPNDDGVFLYQFSDLVDDVAKTYGMDSVNLYRKCGINSFTRYQYLADGTHENATGCRYVGGMIAEAALRSFGA